MAKSKSFDIAVGAYSQSSIGSMMKESVKEELNILPELQQYIRSLKPHEYKQLETSILEKGCLDPLKVWRDSDDKLYIVDGHHRYKICTEYNKEFKIETVYFENIEQVKEYMIQLQLGRRNLTKQELSYYRGLHYIMYKNDFGVRKYNEGEGSTASELAKVHGVSERTITRDAVLTSLIDRLPLEQKQSYLAGESEYTRKMLEEAGKHTESIEEFLDYLKLGTKQEQEEEGHKESEDSNKSNIQSDNTSSDKDVNYSEVFKKKLEQLPKGWKEDIKEEDKATIVSYLEELLNDLKK